MTISLSGTASTQCILESILETREPCLNTFPVDRLTRILQPGLSGNSNTIFIATLTPTEEAREESRSTLRFASFANRIQTRVTVNEKSDARSELRICRRMMHELKQELYRYKARARGSIDAEQRAQNLDKKNRELLALLKQQQECQQRLV